MRVSVDRWKEILLAGQSATNKEFPALTKSIDAGAVSVDGKIKQGLKITDTHTAGAIAYNRVNSYLRTLYSPALVYGFR